MDVVDTMDRFLFICLISFTLLAEIECGRHFRLGRSKGGNLGAPGEAENQKIHELPPAQWFKQKLDHFSVTDSRTWKQVRI